MVKKEWVGLLGKRKKQRQRSFTNSFYNKHSKLQVRGPKRHNMHISRYGYVSEM